MKITKTHSLQYKNFQKICIKKQPVCDKHNRLFCIGGDGGKVIYPLSAFFSVQSYTNQPKNGLFYRVLIC